MSDRKPKDVELSSNSFLSAIPIGKPNEENNEINLKRNQKILNEIKYLDDELNLNKDYHNSIDEEHFNFEKNRQIYLSQAFEISEDERKKWEKRYYTLLKEEGVIKDNDEFNELLKDFDGEISKIKKYSINTKNEYEKINVTEISNYFTKYLILINLLFRTSAVYKFNFELGYKKIMLTIYKMLTLQLFDFVDQKKNTLFSLENLTEQIIFFSMVVVWIFSFIVFIIMTKKYRIKRSISNSRIIYECPSISKKKLICFNFIFLLCIFLYIPITRDSTMTIFFIIENVSISESFKIFFQSNDSNDIILWVKFFLCSVIFVSFIFVPIYIWKLIKHNSPLLDPFNEIQDTIFHSIECPENCSGALVDLDKRMCWDFLKKNLFYLDLKRPINKQNTIEKRNIVLTKYISDCYSINSPIMTLLKGYTYHYRTYLFWFFIKHFVLMLITKMPFSKLFPDFQLEDFSKRSIISYSLATLFCLILIIENFKFLRFKFVQMHDIVLTIIVDFLILIMAILGIVKVSIAGGYLFKTDYNKEDLNQKIIGLEITCFICLNLCYFLVFLFLIYSIPTVKNTIKKKKLEVPFNLFELNGNEIKEKLIECVWKTFWDNLFNSNDIFKKKINNNIEIINELLEFKDISDIRLDDCSFCPFSKLKSLIQQRVKLDIFTEEENEFEKLNICDILIRKLIIFKLEGTDVYWDGDVIGKRTCLNYYGRLIVNDHPFKLLMIYDQSNQKVEIPKSEWITFMNLNMQNAEINRQRQIRYKLRSLHNKEVIFNENYFEDREKENLLKKKKLNLDRESEIKKGILKVISVIEGNNSAHGFKIYIEIKDPKKKKSNELIKFDTNEISLNPRNFKYSRLNILISMNYNLITESNLSQITQSKEKQREKQCIKRYLSEITLSSLFYDLIYNNQEIIFLETIKYFVHFEKRIEMKLVPYIYIDGLIRVFNLWNLTLTNPIQSFWYLFFYYIFQKNKKTIVSKGDSKYFDPDTSLSLCYYILDRDSLNSVLYKLNLHNSFPKGTFEKLFNKISELKRIERDKMESKIKLFDENNENKNNKESDINKEVKKNTKIDEEKLQLYFKNYQEYRDKFFPSLTEYLPIMYLIPSWKYLTFNDEFKFQYYKNDLVNNSRQIIKDYFNNEKRNPDELFSELGEISVYINLYEVSEIIQLYKSKNLNVKDPILARYLVENGENDNIGTKNKDANKKPKGLTALDWGNVTLELKLPPIYKYIDQLFEKQLNDKDYIQKVDDRGRIFYVDMKNKKTSFMHPNLRKRDKTRLENELKHYYGELDKRYEVINYRTSNNELKLLYVDHKEKKTSWKDPRLKKKKENNLE